MDTRDRLEKMRRNIPFVLGYRGLDFGIALVIPTIFDFWSRLGLSMSHVGVMEFYFAAAVIVLELPSGAFADRYGRKTSLTVGVVSWIIGLLIYAASTSFETVLLAETFIAAGLAFGSGADQALLYDSLKELRARQKYAKFTSWMLGSQITMFALANIAGAWLYSVHYRLPWIVAAFTQLLRLPMVLNLAEAQHKKKTGPRKSLGPAIRTALRNAEIRWLLTYWSIVRGFSHAMLWIYPLYLLAVGIPTTWNGVIFAVLNLTAAGATALAPGMILLFGSGPVLGVLGVILVVGIGGMGLSISMFGVLCFLTQQIVRGAGQVAVLEELQKKIPSEHRASLNSLKALCARVTYGLLMLQLGAAVDIWDLHLSLMGTVVILSILLAGSFILKPGTGKGLPEATLT